ncbi:MAG: hypothetical protein IT293_16280 [Deltaproteobacteria bacterium]|nr:hypothetical protein [Deltaproteobacteria bacterium]
MASAVDPSGFPIVRCATCVAEVLGWLDLDRDDRTVVRCVVCSAIADAAAVRFGDLHAIEALGFGFVPPEAGCGRPDCGRGRCGRSDG